MWRSLASNALTLFIVILAGVAGLVAWGQKTYVEPGPLAKAICVRVDKGDSVSAVSRTLVSDKAIRSGTVFRLGADYTKKSGDLKYGNFLVPPQSSMQQIIDILTKGGQSTCGTGINFRIGVTETEMVLRQFDPATEQLQETAKFDPTAKDVSVPAAYTAAEKLPDVRYRVTLAEGVTSWQVANALKKADFLSGAIKDVPKEGSLAPQSYDVTKDEPRADLIAEMQKAQTAILANAWAGRAKDLPYKTQEEALIMASLVEKETGVPQERPEVASVFLNRLDQGIRLQTDPAVIYGITDGKTTLGRGLRQSELRSRANKYNTYVIAGLPPGPIANPGKASIEAALHPAETKYLYFVADGTGGHAFSDTLAEHNRNVAKWREIQAQQKAAGKDTSQQDSEGTGTSGE